MDRRTEKGDFFEIQNQVYPTSKTIFLFCYGISTQYFKIRQISITLFKRDFVEHLFTTCSILFNLLEYITEKGNKFQVCSKQNLIFQHRRVQSQQLHFRYCGQRLSRMWQECEGMLRAEGPRLRDGKTLTSRDEKRGTEFKGSVSQGQKRKLTSEMRI